MITLVLGVLAASLIGSLHCAGMCGGLVAFASASGGSQPAYHLGRLIAYAAIGAVAGSLGAGIELAGSFAGMSGTAAIVAGLLMFGWGAMTLAKSFGVELRLPEAPPSLRHALFRLHGLASSRTPVARSLIVGVATGLLPCGLLYGFAAAASGAGSVAGGAAIMSVFWLGTVPALFGVGLAASRLSGALRVQLPRIAAAVVMLVGLASVVGRLEAARTAPEQSASCHDHR